MQVKIKKLHERAVVPSYAKEGDAGMDLTATTIDHKDGKVFYGTDLALEIPRGYVGLIFPRSSIHKTSLRLANCVGVIDSGYRGEVQIIFDCKREGGHFLPGERVAQLVILPHPMIEFEEVSQLSGSARGEDGFGSSGR